MEGVDEFARSAFEGDFVDQARAAGLGVGKLAGDVVGGEGDVVNAGAVFLKELGDRAFVGCGF